MAFWMDLDGFLLEVPSNAQIVSMEAVDSELTVQSNKDTDSKKTSC